MQSKLRPRDVADRLRGVDGAAFRRALSLFASGVTVITSHDDVGEPVGMTATAFSSVSAEPPQVLVCVKADSRTHGLVTHAGGFGVNILSSADEHISQHCARPGSTKALDPEWLADGGTSVSPVIASALVHLDCGVTQAHDEGTHTIFVGLVRATTFGRPDQPLVYFDGRYGRLHAGAASGGAERSGGVA